MPQPRDDEFKHEQLTFSFFKWILWIQSTPDHELVIESLQVALFVLQTTFSSLDIELQLQETKTLI